MCSEKKDDKVGGEKVPKDLYRRYKQAYTQRKETATEALSNALQLYLEITQNEEGEQNG